MPLVQSSSGTVASVSGTSFTVLLPAAATAGNMLIAAYNATGNFSTPAGWTVLRQSDVWLDLHVYYKTAVAGESSWSFPGTSGGKAAWHVQERSGLGAPDQSSGNSSGSTAVTSQAVAATAELAAANELVLLFAASAATSTLAAAGYTQDADVPLSGASLWVGEQTVAATTGVSATVTSTVSTQLAGIIATFPPIPAAGTLATEVWTGTNGAAWPAQWTGVNNGGTPAATIQSNAGQIVTSAGSYAWIREYVGSMAASANQDATFQVTVNAAALTESFLLVNLACDNVNLAANAWYPSNGYSLRIIPSGAGWDLQRQSGGTQNFTQGAPAMSGGFSWTAGTAVWVRFQVIAGVVRVKFWTGTQASEPGTWAGTWTDPAPLAAGRFSLAPCAGNTTQPTFTFDNLTVTTGAVALTGTAALAGAGSLAAGGSPRPAAPAALSGAGGLSPGPGTPRLTAAAPALSGSGSLGPAATVGLGGVAALGGSGSLAPTSTAVGGPPLALTGAGTLAPGSRTPGAISGAGLGGVGTLAPATTSAGPKGTAALSGAGGLAVGSRTPRPGGAATLSGGGALVPGVALLGWMIFGDGALGAGPGAVLLADEFATQDTGTWAWSGGATVSGGAAVLPDTPGYAASVTSLARYDVSNAALVVQVGAAASAAETFTYLTAPNGTAFFFDLVDGSLLFGADTGGTRVWFGSPLPYSAVDHRWWRHRQARGTLYFDTSPDGLSWTTRASAPVPGDLDLTQIRVQLGCGGGSADQATFAHLRLASNAGSPSVGAASALSGSGGLGTVGRATFAASFAPSATGTLTATGAPGFTPPAYLAPALSGAGTLAFTSGLYGFRQTPAFTGRGALGPAVTMGGAGAVALTASGALGIAALLGGRGAAALTGSGALAPVGVGNPLGRGLLSGAGALVAAGSPGIIAIAPGYAVQFTGAGALGSAATLTQSGAAAFGGVGHLSLVGVYPSGSGAPLMTASVWLTGAGALSSAPTLLVVHGGSPLGGSGALVAGGTPGIGAGLGVAPLGSSPFGGGAPLLVALTGTGGLTSGATTRVVTGALLVGAGSLNVGRTPSLTGTAALTGSGSLAGPGAPGPVGMALLTGGSSLVVTSGPPAIVVGPGLVGVGALAVAVTPRPAVGLYSALAGLGTLSSASGSYGFTPTAALAGSGALGTVAQVALLRAVSLAGLGALATGVLAGPGILAALDGLGSLAGALTRPGITARAQLTGTGTTAVTAGMSTGPSVGLVGIGTLQQVSAAQLSTAANLAALGQLVAAGTSFFGYAAQTGRGVLAITYTRSRIVRSAYRLEVEPAPPVLLVRPAPPSTGLVAGPSHPR